MTGRNGRDKITDVRRYPRQGMPENVRVTITGEGGKKTEGMVMDISPGGAGLRVDQPIDNNAFVELHMEGMRTVPGRVARNFASGIGVEFDLGEGERKDMEKELIKFRIAVARKKF